MRIKSLKILRKTISNTLSDCSDLIGYSYPISSATKDTDEIAKGRKKLIDQLIELRGKLDKQLNAINQLAEKSKTGSEQIGKRLNTLSDKADDLFNACAKFCRTANDDRMEQRRARDEAMIKQRQAVMQERQQHQIAQAMNERKHCTLH